MTSAASSPDHDRRDAPRLAGNRLVIQVLRHFYERGLFPFPALIAVADRDADEDERRKLQERLADGTARVVAPGVHAIQLLSKDWDAAPLIIAWALCRQYEDWRISIPVDFAAFLIGLSVKPLSPSPILYNQPETRRLEEFGLGLVPFKGSSRLFGLTPAGQAVMLATPHDFSEGGLRDLGELAASTWLGEDMLRKWLKRDLEGGLLGERERIVATAILSAPQPDVARRAPVEFDPSAYQQAPRVDEWFTLKSRGKEYLFAELIEGHPHILNGPVKLQTTALVWIDERLGWARTRSRVYRLGKKKLTDYP